MLVVEKPGVEFGFNPPRPGTAEGCSSTFLQEHTLDRWTAANDAALKSALRTSGIPQTSVLAVGHSEGGIVAASLAARNPKVTHVALLAGGGPKQSEDLKVIFGQQTAETMLSDIAKDPKSTTKFVFGHPYLRWSTFMATSTIEQSLKNKASIFVGQGTNDRSVNPESADLLTSTLQRRGRDVTLIKVTGGDHGFSTDPSDRTGKGFSDMFDKVLEWFRSK